MTIAEIRKIESERTDQKQMVTVHLVKEASFYHANDWSAWLLVQFPVGEAKSKPMNVTAKCLKDGYIHVFVGFPVSSLAKYVPAEETAGFEAVNDNQLDVTLNVDLGEATYDDIRQQVDEWKAQLPVNDTRAQRRENREVAEMARKATRMSDVVARILSFPLACKSPLEAWEFLRGLQQEAAALF